MASTTDRPLVSQDVCTFLRSPTAYPDGSLDVRTIETHISWVFLTDRYAYKLKKPVKFDFVDFSTVALRHRACQDELRLNRRLAPDVYLAVLPVAADDKASLKLGGAGAAVDWVVQMRRLPEDKALDRLLGENRLAREDAEAIADYLANFYVQSPAQSVRPDDFHRAIDRHIRANEAVLIETLPDDRARLRRIHSAQLRFLHIQRPLFDNRVAAGRVVDGHGDLRPEHIYLTQPLAVIDCIEFSDELRRVDIADELSFFAMECERLARSSLGEVVFNAYENKAGDQIRPALSAFYRSYRACVRAKVTMLQLGQHADDRQQALRRLTHEYLQWADHHAARLGPPLLLVVYGLMGSGKSTVANQLAKTLGADVLSTDRERRATFGSSPSPAAYGEGLYRPQQRRQIYEALFRQASALLDQGQSVILDGAFLSRELRAEASNLAHRHGAVPVTILCECPRDVALSRIRQRAETGGSSSEARADLYDLQAREFQPPSGEGANVCVNTTIDSVDQLEIVFDGLRRTMNK